jgi:uncharacterized membrane protein (DUF485 family)
MVQRNIGRGAVSVPSARLLGRRSPAPRHPHTAQENPSMPRPAVNWAAIDADPRFQELHRKKMAFLWGLMIFSIVYYFLLPIGAAYFPELFKIKVWGPVNVGILFALSEFIVAWAIAGIYAWRANREFDAMAAEIVRDAAKIGA